MKLWYIRMCCHDNHCLGLYFQPQYSWKEFIQLWRATQGPSTGVPLAAFTWNHCPFPWNGGETLVLFQYKFHLVKQVSKCLPSQENGYMMYIKELGCSFTVELLGWDFIQSVWGHSSMLGIWREACRSQRSVWQSCAPVCRACGHALFLSLKWWGVSCIVACKCFFVDWVCLISLSHGPKNVGVRSPFQGKVCVISFCPYCTSRAAGLFDCCASCSLRQLRDTRTTWESTASVPMTNEGHDLVVYLLSPLALVASPTCHQVSLVSKLSAPHSPLWVLARYTHLWWGAGGFGLCHS